MHFKSNFQDIEDFQNFSWLCPPTNFLFGPEGLEIAPDPQTDNWQRTHYGFSHDNVHFFYTHVAGDFSVQTTVHFKSLHRYDQAGLYIRVDADNWIKTGIEYETEDFSHLGAVVTNFGFSDWSTQEIPGDINVVNYKIIRKNTDFEIYARYRENRFEQIRITHLHNASKILKVGIYACCPNDNGMIALFKKLELKTTEATGLHKSL